MEKTNLEINGNVVVTDNRSTNTIELEKLESGHYFMWRDEYLCRKIAVTDDVIEWRVEGDKILCEFAQTGEVVAIDRHARVEPVDVEIIIVD